MVIYLSLQAQRMLLLEIIFSVLCCVYLQTAPWSDGSAMWSVEAALDIIYTEAAVGTTVVPS